MFLNCQEILSRWPTEDIKYHFRQYEVCMHVIPSNSEDFMSDKLFSGNYKIYMSTNNHRKNIEQYWKLILIHITLQIARIHAEFFLPSSVHQVEMGI